ncbi:MAG: TonB-dependent receptor [Melioribacteraceae bacterium]|nr:TonB-dependent receptor [Melioribacteraceae bacterium]
MFELYFSTPSFTVFGNKDLKPEQSNSIELAYLTSFSNFFVQVLAYQSDYDNKIFRAIRDVTLEDGTVLPS